MWKITRIHFRAHIEEKMNYTLKYLLAGRPAGYQKKKQRNKGITCTTKPAHSPDRLPKPWLDSCRCLAVRSGSKQAACALQQCHSKQEKVHCRAAENLMQSHRWTYHGNVYSASFLLIKSRYRIRTETEGGYSCLLRLSVGYIHK